MKIFETHAHYEDEQFKDDFAAVLEEVRNTGVEKIVNVGSSMETSRKSVKLAEKYDCFYAAVGIHPDNAGECTESAIAELRQMAENEKVISIGEIGLDYYWDNCEHEVQKHAFEKQLELAMELELPVIIHSREACEDTLVIMREYTKKLVAAGKKNRGVIHCYSYSPEVAKEYVAMGYYIGVGGVVTFKNARKLVETVEAVSLDKIVIETDSPYLAPVPFRGKRNDSSKLTYVIEKIAEIKGISVDETAETVWKNSFDMYGLK